MVFSVDDAFSTTTVIPRWHHAVTIFESCNVWLLCPIILEAIHIATEPGSPKKVQTILIHIGKTTLCSPIATINSFLNPNAISL